MAWAPGRALCDDERHCVQPNRPDECRAGPRDDDHDDVLELACWGCACCSRFPPLRAEGDERRSFDAERRSIIARETAELASLADELARQGKTDAANLVRAEIPRLAVPDGPTRFMPLPEVVEPRKSTDARSLPAGASDIRKRAATALFDARQEGGTVRVGAVRSGERLPARGARARPRSQGSPAAAGICSS